jgi:hypothetical protein
LRLFEAWCSVALASDDPVMPAVPGLEVRTSAVIGVEWLVFVGAEADVTRLDPAATETVRIVPAALGVEVARRAVVARARVEEGQVHAGGSSCPRRPSACVRGEGGRPSSSDVPTCR